MIQHAHNGLNYLSFKTIDAARVHHGVFTRHGGVSEPPYASLNLSRSTGDGAEPVRENRRRMFEALGTTPERSLTSWLVHGNTVRVLDETMLAHKPFSDDAHADAMITRSRCLALTLRFADCVPVVFYDPARAAIGIAHAGWLGIENGVLGATVQAMATAFGSRPSDIQAGIGPSIGPDRFEVGEDVAERIQRAAPEPVIVRRHGAPRPFVDLWRAAAAQLRQAGLESIETAGVCTATDNLDWFSHRAEQGKTGRFGVAILLV
ncbi:MAG: peptidoglycan editing factor PgeF [Thermoflexales bacterium]